MKNNNVLYYANEALKIINIIYLIFFFIYVYFQEFKVIVTERDVASFNSVLLTSLGLIITVLAVIIAILCFFGYSAIEKKAEESAIQKAEIHARKIAQEIVGEEIEHLRKLYEGLLHQESGRKLKPELKEEE